MFVVIETATDKEQFICDKMDDAIHMNRRLNEVYGKGSHKVRGPAGKAFIYFPPKRK